MTPTPEAIRQLMADLRYSDDRVNFALTDAAIDALGQYADLLAQRAQETWQPIETHDGSATSVLLYVPLDNGSAPRMARLIGFFAKAGSLEMDTDDDSLVNEEGCNYEDAWFSESDDREPYAMMLHYRPTHWKPLPDPPAKDLP